MTSSQNYFKGLLGAAAPFGSVAFSVLAEVEIWLRLLALVIGIVTSILYGVHLWHKIKEQRKALRGAKK